MGCLIFMFKKSGEVIRLIYKKMLLYNLSIFLSWYELKKSKEVIDVYLKYVSVDDLHIYSIDECFLDLTNYMKLYKKSTKEIALDILKNIKNDTGLYATAGIGPNM